VIPASIAILIGAAHVFGATTPKPQAVVHTHAAESTVAADGTYLAWAAAPRAHPRRTVVLARRGGGTPIHVSAPGTAGYLGGIDGTTLVYQQISGGRSDLYSFDLRTKRRVKLSAIDTPSWEWSPSISGNRILFTRNVGNRRLMLLYDRTTGKTRQLDSSPLRGVAALTGQISENYAVWSACKPKCNVIRLDLRTGTRVRIPNPRGLYQYASSVTPTGTVFYVRSGNGCGIDATLLRYAPGGRPQTLLELPDGVDTGDTFAQRRNGRTRLLFDRVDCRTHASDIYQLVLR
jgi:hypothetical protein